MNNHETGELPAAPLPSGMLVVGECLVDLAPEAMTSPAGSVKARRYVAIPGGGPANTAVGLARLGVRTTFAGRLSRDGFGPWLRDHLVANGVDVSASVDAKEPATLALVTLDPQMRASYTFYGPETADWQWEEAELPAPARETLHDQGITAVHTGSLVTVFDPAAKVLARWLAALRQRANVVVSFDPNVRAGLVDDMAAYRRELEGMLASAHIVKASIEDVEAICPGATPVDAAERWIAAGACLVVVTAGQDGATAFHQNGARARAAPPLVEVADTIGAGDSFSAALLAWFADEGILTPSGIAGTTEDQLQTAVARAAAAGAFTCTRPGADPPNRDELTAFVARGASP